MNTDFTTLNELVDKYRFALMCELDNCQELEDAIKSQAITTAEKLIQDSHAEVAAKQSQLQEAYELGHKGSAKASVDFQSFLVEIKASGDTVFLNAVLSCHDRGLAEYQDEKTAEAVALAEQPTGIETTEEEPPKELPTEAPDNQDLARSILQSLNDNAFATPPSAPTPAEEIQFLIEKIKQFRSWQNDCEKIRELQEAVERIGVLDAKRGAKAQRLLDQGKGISQLNDKVREIARSSDEKQLPVSLKKEAYALGATPQEVSHLFSIFNKAKKKQKQIYQDLKARKENPPAKLDIPLYEATKQHPKYLGNMPWCKQWNIFIDETGCRFDTSVFQQDTKANEKGKLVALFVPENSPLPPLGSHHATDEGTLRNQQILQDLFQKGEGCGILGVNLDAMPNAPLDYWYAGLERLIDLSLRFLPELPEKTTLNFYVENRGDASLEGIEKNKALIRRTAETCLYRFAKVYPQKADLLEIKIHNCAKHQTDDKVFLAHNGYVDTLACAWNGARKELRNMLRDHGLFHRCLLDGNSQELPFLMDRIAQGESIPTEQWNELLDSPDTMTADSPVALLLAKQGYLVRTNLDAWTAYVNATVGHLNSKAIRLFHLGKQLNWLTEYMPPEGNIPKRLRLIWLTSKLAEANHRGVIAPALLEELNQLVKDLYLEDAPLCCWAVLNLAVERTNAFQFEEASKIITNFAAKAELFQKEPPFSDFLAAIQRGEPAPMDPKVAVYGLLYYGQLLSSLGQHNAFLGNHAKANQYFEAAILCYKQLSEDSSFDISQTTSYLVTNLMDYTPPSIIRGKLEEYLGGELETIAQAFARSNSAHEKYKHLVMLRYFQELPKDHPAIKAYLAAKKSWKTDIGHPWEMIEFYRALLLDEATERLEHLGKAYELAKTDSGPTMLVIACVILGAVRAFTKLLDTEKYLAVVENVVNQVPDLGDIRINALRNQATTPVQPLKLAKIVLPFNFR